MRRPWKKFKYARDGAWLDVSFDEGEARVLQVHAQRASQGQGLSRQGDEDQRKYTGELSFLREPQSVHIYMTTYLSLKTV